MTQLHEYSALQQAQLIRRREISSVELVHHYLARIEGHDGTLHAFEATAPDLALADAQAADQRLRKHRGDDAGLASLHGVPIALKDNVEVAGIPTRHGSLLTDSEPGEEDDYVVSRIRSAGMPILGTTKTSEFELPCYTENLLGPPTQNPWAAGYSPGGSSGGSACAVAAGLAPLAHGTDSGGSVRIPASACGIIGLKPSRHRVSSGPRYRDPSGLTSAGVLARTADDAQALLRIISGLQPGDTATTPSIQEPSAAHRLNVLAMPTPMAPDIDAHPSCLEAIAHATSLLEDLGHVVENLDMDGDENITGAFKRVWATVTASNEVIANGDPSRMMPFTRYMLDVGRQVTSTQFYTALTVFDGIAQMFADFFFATYDAILVPTLGTPPAKIGQFRSDDEAVNFDNMTAYMPYTPLQNILGTPAISVPLSWNSEGLPIGVMLFTRYGTDERVIALADQLLTANGPAPRTAIFTQH